jgi:ATP/ADP translocase
MFHPDEESINLYIENYNNFKWVIKLLGKWGYVLIYIFSDLWSSVVINLIFWQFVNNTTDKDVAKRFYPTLGMIGNLGSVFAGLLLIFFTSNTFLDDDFILSFFSPKNHCTSETFIKITLSTVVGINFFSVLLFNFVYKKLQAVDSENKKILNQKTKLSIFESIKLILSSRYILNICVMVICYSFAINILEGPWKNSIKIIYPKLKDYAGFMGKFNVFLGFASIFFVFLGNFIFQFLNWSYAIFFSPILIGISGLLFFILISF